MPRSRLLKTTFVAILALIAAEIGLRVFLGMGTPPLSQSDPDIGYLFQANQDITRFGNRVIINEYDQQSEPLGDIDSERYIKPIDLKCVS